MNKNSGDDDQARICPACRGTQTWVVLDNPIDYEYDVVMPRPFRILGCKVCESQWLYPRPSVDELIEFYPDDYHAYNDDHGFVASVLVGVRGWLRAQQYAGYLPNAGGFVFDLGAGDCRHFREISASGKHHCAGVEINAEMAEQARSAGFDVESGTLEEIDITRHLDKYHIVSMNHVLEHVLDPTEVLQKSFSMLISGGRLIGQLPTVSSWEVRAFSDCWAGYHFPRHTQLFSRQGLVSVLESCGFSDVVVRSTPHVQSSLSVQNFMVKKFGRKGMSMGRKPYFGMLLLASLPVEVLAFLLNSSGVVNFEAIRR